MTESLLVEKIVEIIRGSSDIHPKGSLDGVSLGTRFREDLGLDSMALMAITFELLEIAPNLDETAIAGWKTIGDCVAAVNAAR